MTIEQILEILENYKLRIPPTVFYDLKADIVNFEEPTTKNDLGVDCISRQAVIDLMMQKWGENFSGDDAMQESIDAIRELPSVTPQEPQTFRWCTDCKEYDQEKHCCHRWSKAIRDTVAEMKQEYIEREVLDKIRAELYATAEMHDDGDYYLREEWIDEILDNYKTETEE